MSQNTDPWIGRQVGRYTLRQRLGSGGSGAVYAAWDEQLEREVALKLLLMLPGATTEMIERFQREAKLTARLNHPNIVPIYEIGEDAGVLYIAMRRLSGATLRDQLVDQGRLSQSDAIQIAISLAQALEYAHQNNIVHRDIKPANVLFDDGGRPMLVDFGIAKALDMRGKGLTLTGTTIGTPPYMSPEQASGEKLDHRSDIYSLGILLYHLVAGRPPFQGNAPTVMQAHLFQAPTPPRRLRPDLNPELEKVILKALAKKPHERFQSATEMGQALNAILLGQPTRILVPPSATQPVPATRAANAPSYSGTGQPPASPSARPPIAQNPSRRNPPRQQQSRPQSRSVPIWSLTILLLLLLCSIGAVIAGSYYFSAGDDNNNGGEVVSAPATLTLLVPTNTPIPPTETAAPAPEVIEPPQEEATNTPTEEPVVEDTPTATPTETVAEPPTETPAEQPTEPPAEQPTETPTVLPTETPTALPTETPTALPSETPTALPSETPTEVPSETPTEVPSETPTEVPSETPTEVPSETPTEVPAPPTATATEVPATPTATATELPPAPTAVPEPTNTPIGEILSCPAEPDSDFVGFFDLISMGCMQAEAVSASGVYQPFTNGFMIHDQRADQNLIYAFDQTTERWQTYDSTWQAGDDEFSCPDARFAGAPRDAIGLLWCQDADIQDTFGNVTAEPIESELVFQSAKNALLIYVEELSARIALFDNNNNNKSFITDLPSAVIGYPAP